MGADPSLIVSGISAVLQAAQTWMTYRDARRASNAFESVIGTGESNPVLAQTTRQLINLAPEKEVQSLGLRVEKCWVRYSEILDSEEGSYMPQEIDSATEAVKRCICRELKRLKSINGSLPPGKLSEWWSEYKCH